MSRWTFVAYPTSQDARPVASKNQLKGISVPDVLYAGDLLCFFEYSADRKVNVSLQSALAAVVEDINVLSEFGLKTERHGAPRLHLVHVAVLSWALFWIGCYAPISGRILRVCVPERWHQVYDTKLEPHQASRVWGCIFAGLGSGFIYVLAQVVCFPKT